MMISKQGFYFCAVFFFLGLILVIVSIVHENKKMADGSRRTFESSIHDTIASINCNKSIITLQLRRTKEPYYFAQATESYLALDIMQFADWNDEVSKTAFSNVIKIKHKGVTREFKLYK